MQTTRFFAYLLPEDVDPDAERQFDFDDENCAAIVTIVRATEDQSSPWMIGECWPQAGQAQSDGQNWYDAVLHFCQFYCIESGDRGFCLWDDAEGRWDWYEANAGHDWCHNVLNRLITTEHELGNVTDTQAAALTQFLARSLTTKQFKDIERAVDELLKEEEERRTCGFLLREVLKQVT